MSVVCCLWELAMEYLTSIHRIERNRISTVEALNLNLFAKVTAQQEKLMHIYSSIFRLMSMMLGSKKDAI